MLWGRYCGIPKNVLSNSRLQSMDVPIVPKNFMVHALMLLAAEVFPNFSNFFTIRTLRTKGSVTVQHTRICKIKVLRGEMDLVIETLCTM